MIYEYAIEPELAATWYDRANFRYFKEQFCPGTARVVSQFPSKWKRLIWKAFRASGALDDNTRPRMAELIQLISENLIGRPGHLWNDDLTWLNNALHEHHRLPFHAILARSPIAECAEALTENDIDIEHDRWAVPTGRTINRTAEASAEAVGSMLRLSRRIILVDYMLGLENRRYRQTVRMFLAAAGISRPNANLDTVEIVSASNAAADFFLKTCRQQLPRLIPPGVKVRVWKIAQLEGGDRPHNRFILTNLGGVQFGYGLDEGRGGGELDDVSIMSA